LKTNLSNTPKNTPCLKPLGPQRQQSVLLKLPPNELGSGCVRNAGLHLPTLGHRVDQASQTSSRGSAKKHAYLF
jgi:hypothetical protein